MTQVIQQHLADLPDLVTPEILAAKLGIKTKTLYQRLWRQKKSFPQSIATAATNPWLQQGRVCTSIVY